MLSTLRHKAGELLLFGALTVLLAAVSTDRAFAQCDTSSDCYPDDPINQCDTYQICFISQEDEGGVIMACGDCHGWLCFWGYQFVGSCSTTICSQSYNTCG
jgi:hypothetical protein